MTFVKGNKIAKKLSTNELKREAFDSYLAHIAKGKSKKSWWFEKDDLTVTWQTMDTYIKNEPAVFNPIQIEKAKSSGYLIWEQVVEDSAIGKNKDANTASLQMLMRNKFRWDKDDEINRSSNETLAAKLISLIENSQEEK